MAWRDVRGADEGQELFVKSLSLADADFNKGGVAVGTIFKGDPHMYALCAVWSDPQDCYITKEINAPFRVHELPE